MLLFGIRIVRVCLEDKGGLVHFNDDSKVEERDWNRYKSLRKNRDQRITFLILGMGTQ